MLCILLIYMHINYYLLHHCVLEICHVCVPPE